MAIPLKTLFLRWWKRSLLLSAVAFLMPLLLISCLVMIPATQIPAPESMPSEDQTSPKFKQGECFQHNGMREPWESQRPDGIVVLVGYEKYLVMFREEAEKTGGGDKYAAAVTFETLDRDFHHIACPRSWKEHTHGEEVQRVLHAYGTPRAKAL